jgi:hypothetical protein
MFIEDGGAVLLENTVLIKFSSALLGTGLTEDFF